jgi:subtilisin family serine protease
MLTPSNSPHVVSVAASKIDDGLARFSNYGRCVHIIAPGEEIISAWIGSRGDETKTISGTSMASPHVAGLAAVLRSSFPNLSPAQVRDRLMGFATKGIIRDVPEGTRNQLAFVGISVKSK